MDRSLSLVAFVAFVIIFSISFMQIQAISALKDIEVKQVELVIENHRFSPDVITINTKTKLDIIVQNNDDSVEEIDSTELRVEKIIGAKSKGHIRVGPLKAGTYEFEGEFNSKTAQGKIIVKD